MQYDGAGRETASYVTDGGGDGAVGSGWSWNDAGNLIGDNVLTQTETQYDPNGNPILVTTRDRFHDETATGALRDATTAPKARVSYAAAYYDAADRPSAEVDVGTNGGVAYQRLSTPPAPSDTVLVTGYGYRGDSVQQVQLTGSPAGGTFTLTFNGQTTAPIAYNAAAGTVQTALQNLSTIGSGNALVAGAPGGPWQVRFAAALSGAVQPMLTGNSSGLTGGTSPSVATAVTSLGGDAGRLQQVTDPRGLVTKADYDWLGRTLRTVEAFSAFNPSSSADKTTEYTYDGDGNILTLRADEPNGAGQTTQYVYGVSAATGSDITSNDILAAVRHPDPNTGQASAAQQDTVTVNALGEIKTATDRNGTLHTYGYDILGRQINDAITTLGTGVDGSVRRIQTAYDTGGRRYLFTSYDAATGGNIVNQVQRTYNGLDQLTAEYQSHAGAVNTSTTPAVQYAYNQMAGGANNSRLLSMTYPNGRVLNYNYASGLDSNISRLSSISDSSATLESYKYLGLDTVVERDHPQTNVNLTYISQTGGTGDAGDKYIGLDRFGRVVDQNWYNTATSTSTDRFQYGYDRDGNRLYRLNAINAVFSELYHASGAGNGYDPLNQLTGFARGVLSPSTQGGPLDTVASPTTTESWNLDALGNWSSVTANGSTQTRTANQQNEVTAAGAQALAYDANGNTLTDDRGQHYVYDAWNRLVQVKGASNTTLASYSYDALGRRIVENESGTVRDLYYSDAWQVVEERVAGQAKVQYVWSPVYADALVERDRDPNNSGSLSERLYVQQDANWNVTALVDTSGNVKERYIYDPYGQVTVLSATWGVLSGSAYAWNYLYQGGRSDWMAGLYNFRNRDYSPTLGRWMQADPAGFAAGDSNLYGFNFSSPENLTDPTGLGSRVGHHWIPVSVLEEAYKNGEITREAYHAGLGAYSGWLGHKHGYGEYGGIQHSAYNEEIRKLLKEYVEKYGKLSGKQMFEFIQDVKTYHLRHPESIIGKFNAAISKCRDAWVAAGKGRGFRQADSLKVFLKRGKSFARRLKAWRIAKAAGSALKRVAKKAGRTGKKGSKMIPVVGSIMTILFWGQDVKAKGAVNGTANSVIDAIPVVGLVKGGIELIVGEDFIPDLESELPPITDADIDEIDAPEEPDEEGGTGMPWTGGGYGGLGGPPGGPGFGGYQGGGGMGGFGGGFGGGLGGGGMYGGQGGTAGSGGFQRGR